MDSKEEVLLQNARFYEAFENADIDTLEAVWSHGRHVKCIHPGWTVLEGWSAVKKSWTDIFSRGMEMKISLRNVTVEVYGTLGVVILMEEIVYQSGKVRNSGTVMATNLFEFDGREWKMIHHHGSPMMVVEQEEEKENYRYN